MDKLRVAGVDSANAVSPLPALFSICTVLLRGPTSVVALTSCRWSGVTTTLFGRREG